MAPQSHGVHLTDGLQKPPTCNPVESGNFYPELGDEWRITPEERVALHVHEEILQLVENLWLGLGLERRETDIGRGWMNTLRRLTITSSFRRFWPLLRAEYDPNFQSYCERLLRLDADDPRLVELVPRSTPPSLEDPCVERLDGWIYSTAKQVQDVAAEFAREWPDFVIEDLVRIRCRGCDLRLMSAVNDVSGIPTAGKSLIIVADVKEVLHFRAFDSNGKVVVDTDEKQLTEQAPRIKVLRKQHKNLFATLTSIVGHDMGSNTLQWMPSLNNESKIPTEEKNMIIVADVKKVPHFRIFDADGKRKDTEEKKLTDTEEKKLTEQAKQNEPFRKQLEDFFAALTSIVGHTHGESLDRLGALYLQQLIQHAVILKTRDHAWRMAWLIVQPPKHHVPTLEQTHDFIVGILIITPAEVPADGYDLFLWIRPAHRSSGIGEKIILDEKVKALDWQLIDFALEERVGKHLEEKIIVDTKNGALDGQLNASTKEIRKLRDLKIKVRYPATGVLDDIWSRKRWLNFFGLYDYKPEPKTKAEAEPEPELEPGKEWVLSRRLVADPRLVKLIPSTSPEAPNAEMLDGQICSTAKQVQDLAAEFAREWPGFVRQELRNSDGELIERLGPLYVHQLIQRSAKLVTADHASCPAWLIVRPLKHHVPDLEQNQDFIAGFLIITPAVKHADGYDLFYWICPAHRSSGIGEKIILDKKIIALDRQLIDHAIKGGLKRTTKLRVRYPATGVRDDIWSQKRWCKFFELHDFKHEQELEPGKEWVLSRRLDADPRLVQLVPSTTKPSPKAPYAQMLDGKICSTAKQVQDLAAEFAREWPEFVRQELRNSGGELIERLGPLYVHQLIQRSAKLVTDDHASCAAWLIVRPLKHHVPDLEQNQDFIAGILIIIPAAKPADGYDLFYWIHPAHRSSGIGEKIILDEKIVALDRQLIDVAKQDGSKRKTKLRVRYPDIRVRVDDWNRNRNRWNNFFGLYDFKPEHELKPGEESVLSRELKEN